MIVLLSVQQFASLTPFVFHDAGEDLEWHDEIGRRFKSDQSHDLKTSFGTSRRRFTLSEGKLQMRL